VDLGWIGAGSELDQSWIRTWICAGS